MDLIFATFVRLTEVKFGERKRIKKIKNIQLQTTKYKQNTYRKDTTAMNATFSNAEIGFN